MQNSYPAAHRLSVYELLERYEAGERSFCGADLSEENLSEAVLTDINLERANLRGSCLYKASLGFAKLDGAWLQDADLREADLRGADLDEAKLGGAKLTKADLNAAHLEGAFLGWAHLGKADLEGAHLKGAHLGKADLEGADLRGADLRGAFLGWAHLEGAHLEEAHLEGADLEGAHLEEAHLEGAKLTKGDTIEANRAGADLAGDKGTDTKLNEGILSLSHKANDSDDLHNQALGANPLVWWNGLRFRSKTEVKIAEALENMNALFFPNCRGRVGPLGNRQNREPDFLVSYNGKWGILEVDGHSFHPPERSAAEHERDRLFHHHGVVWVQRFDATRCYNQPDSVVREFLELLSK